MRTSDSNGQRLDRLERRVDDCIVRLLELELMVRQFALDDADDDR